MIVNWFISILILPLSAIHSHSYDIANTKQSQRMNYEWGEGKHNTVTMDGYLQCSNDSACPTWFVCEKESVTAEMAITTLLSVMRKSTFQEF